MALRYAVADVTTPLDSVSQICDAGNSVVFNSWGGYIVGPGGRVDFERIGDTYHRTTWVKRPRRRKPTVDPDGDDPMGQTPAKAPARTKTPAAAEKAKTENDDKGAFRRLGSPGP